MATFHAIFGSNDSLHATFSGSSTFTATFLSQSSFPSDFAGGRSFNTDFSGSSSFGMSMGSAVEVPIGDFYEGPYTVTPNQSTQVLPTRHLDMWQDVIVEPIPSNYGLITWDGAKLTVS